MNIMHPSLALLSQDNKAYMRSLSSLLLRLVMHQSNWQEARQMAYGLLVERRRKNFRMAVRKAEARLAEDDREVDETAQRIFSLTEYIS